MRRGNHWSGGHGSREAFWRGVIESYTPERGAVEAHCERLGVSMASFYRWRRKLGASGVARQRDRAFVQLEVVQDATTSAAGEQAAPAGAASMHMEVILPGRRVVRLSDDFDVQALSRLLPVLEA